MLRELVLHEKIREIPGYMTISPEGAMIMTRKEMNDLIEKTFEETRKSHEKEES